MRFVGAAMATGRGDLNPEQREAAEHLDGPLLILAGAGSGKTRVITHRVAHLVREARVPAAGILAVTFTNKAADEMRRRVGDLLGAAARMVWISTFHSAGVRILRDHGRHLGLPPNLLIYDDADQRGLIRRLLKQLGWAESTLTPRQVLSRIDAAKSRGQGPDEMDISDFDFVGERIRTLYVEYQRALRAADAVDFGDLLMESVRLLREVPEVRAHYQDRLRHLMVDEFQDTNSVQYELLRLLCGPHRNLVVVGDDDQSIYRWRGADIRNILSFERDFPGAKVVRLEQNYRSTQLILDAAWQVIRHNRDRKEKRLWTEQAGGEQVDVLQSSDEQEEALRVAATVDRLSEEYPLEEIAVFYRVNAQSRVLEDALRAARLPYHVVRGRSFYDRAEIKDLTAYLRLAVNPRSDADLLRVINTPRRGIGKKTVERLDAAARSRGVSLFEALAPDQPIPEVAVGTRRKLDRFRDLLQGLHESVEADRPPHEIVESAIEDSGYADALREEGTEEAEERLENLTEMVGAAAQRADEGRSLVDFLDEVALTADADDQLEEGHRINLMTLHAAKGLEFDAVIIVGLEERTFPHARAFREEGYDFDAEEMSEERRLCYVGFTRARRRLVVSWARTRWLLGQRQVRGPSRFLTDLPEELLSGPVVTAPLQPAWSDGPRQAAELPWALNRGASHDALEDEPELGDEDGIVVDYAFDQRPEHERLDSVPRRGRRVLHRTFGEGEIRSIEGRGPTARLLVHFEGVGTKKILARYVEMI